MTNRFGYRVERDPVDGLWYVTDAHGDTVHGPHETEAAGWAWVEEWTALRLARRDQVQEEEAVRRQTSESKE